MNINVFFRVILPILILIGCKKEKSVTKTDETANEQNKNATTDYTILSGKIKTKDTLYLFGPRYRKKILVKNNSFRDTLSISLPGYYDLMTDYQEVKVYLKKGFDLKVSVEENQSGIGKKITYAGKGAYVNYYVLKVKEYFENNFNEGYFIELNNEQTEKQIEAHKEDLYHLMSQYDKLDSAFVSDEKKNFNTIFRSFKSKLENTKLIADKNYGKSPVFTDYENIDGSRHHSKICEESMFILIFGLLGAHRVCTKFLI